jgi:hypothetical protein
MVKSEKLKRDGDETHERRDWQNNGDRIKANPRRTQRAGGPGATSERWKQRGILALFAKLGWAPGKVTFLQHDYTTGENPWFLQSIDYTTGPRNHARAKTAGKRHVYRRGDPEGRLTRAPPATRPPDGFAFRRYRRGRVVERHVDSTLLGASPQTPGFFKALAPMSNVWVHQVLVDQSL